MVGELRERERELKSTQSDLDSTISERDVLKRKLSAVHLSLSLSLSYTHTLFPGLSRVFEGYLRFE